MTPSDTSSDSSSAAAWLALPLGSAPLGGEGVLGAAITDVTSAAIASGVLVGLLALLAGLLRGGRPPAPAAVPVRSRDARRARR
jgi:hypothetical protein